MIKAVILDMDGTMFATEDIYIEEAVKLQEELGLPPIREVLLGSIGADRETCRIRNREAFGAENYEKYWPLFHELFERIHDGRAPVMKGLFALLDFCKSGGYKLGVATSTSRAAALPGLAATGTDKYFDVMLFGDMVPPGRGKPAPDIYLMACEALGVSPREAMGVEDSRHGVMALHAAGLRTVMIPNMLPFTPDLQGVVDHLLEDLGQVIGLLEEDRKKQREED